MTPQFPDFLHFPREEDIACYLEDHPLTDGSDSNYLKKNESHLKSRIIAVAARAFAEQFITPETVKAWMQLAIDDDTEITLSNESRLWVILNLTHALKQCAKGAPIMRFQRK